MAIPTLGSEKIPIRTIGKNFIMSFRPLSLWASIFSVLIGWAASWRGTGLFARQIYRFHNMAILGLCLILAVSLQIACNFANDYYDIKSGLDYNRPKEQEDQARTTLEPKSYLRRFIIFLLLAILSGISAVVLSNIVIGGKIIMLFLGALCLFAVWGYSGSKHPYGYQGLGEIMSFAFFGPVSVVGTYYLLGSEKRLFNGHDFSVVLGASIAYGLVVAAMLMIDNLRDLKSDSENGKITLPFYLGKNFAKIVYFVILILAAILGGFVMPNNLIILPVIIIVSGFQIYNFTQDNWKSAFKMHALIGILFGLYLL
ncbi:MAG: 1,4-dihydroxy-2-naphthoate octaprenyltransferase [Candidatus Ancillula sp.]|jgi:1,4-dihydroxy-2-naphthoate octaprenyltransferase|nr:1,4-dihydroxy-2-naphthoate octaprenyltransferase [Candidatus Ancillula sp.]